MGCVPGPTSAKGVCHQCHLKTLLSFFFFPPVSKTNKKKGNFLTCGQLRKEKLLLRECWGRCLRQEVPTTREDPPAVSPLHTGDAALAGDMGPALLLLTAAGIWHGRSTSPPKPSDVSLAQLWDAARVSWMSGVSAASLLGQGGVTASAGLGTGQCCS